MVVDYQVRFKIDYANRGSQPARNAVLTFRKPEQLGNQAVILLHGPGVQPGGLSQNGAEARIALADLAPGASGSIVLGFAIPG